MFMYVLRDTLLLLSTYRARSTFVDTMYNVDSMWLYLYVLGVRTLHHAFSISNASALKLTHLLWQVVILNESPLIV